MSDQEIIKKGLRDGFVMVVKLSIIELECIINDCLGNDDFTAAMKACGELAPMMNKYMDEPEDRETNVIARWKVCCDRIGVEWGKIENRSLVA